MVPANRRREGGETLEIAHVILPATTDTPGAPILYLAGGPGGSGISEAGVPHMAVLFQSLREVADVVLVDQRGTGRSVPRLACPNEGAVPADVFVSRDVAAGTGPFGAPCRALAAARLPDLPVDRDRRARWNGAPRLGSGGAPPGRPGALSSLRVS